MATLSDVELERVRQMLENEVVARRERDTDAARLLFSTLPTDELETARKQIITAQDTRARYRRTLPPITEPEIFALAVAGSNGCGSDRADMPLQEPKQTHLRQISAPPAHKSLACGGLRSDECDDRGRGRAQKENETEMTAFTITDDNNITALASASEAAQTGDKAALMFDSRAQLGRMAAEWPMSRLVEIYNSIPGNGEVKRFANRNKAVARIWDAIQPLGRSLAATDVGTEGARHEKATEPANAAATRKPPKPAVAAKPNKAAKTAKPRNAKAARQSAPEIRGSSKKAAVIALMRRPEGVTLAEIMAATGWQAHTVRGMISILASKAGVKVESSKNASGERTYRVPK
jgi:hypothetical protein